MSFIPHRPDSRKTGNRPDARMLRKLVRDCNCHPVLQGILESLLHYLTQDLPKWTMGNRHLEKPGSNAVCERNINWPDQRSENSTNQTQLKTSCSTANLPGKHKPTMKKTAKASSKIHENCSTNPQKLESRHGGNHRTGLVPRHLTTFQLLQSKFMRSTPKPPVTHQREVGTLPSIHRATDDLNHLPCSDLIMHTKNQTRKKQGMRRGSGVKDIVAKFAIAKNKEMEATVLEKQPVKPRLIGRGILLSSLMERFETMATVYKGSTLKCSQQCANGRVKVMTSDVKQMVACHERRHQQTVSENLPKKSQHKKIKSKASGLHLKGNQTTDRHEQRPEVAENTKIKSNLDKKSNLKEDQMSKHSDENQCLFECIKPQAYDKVVESLKLEQYGEIQITAQETSISSKFKYGHLEVLYLISVTECLLPEPYRLLPQVQAQMTWHVGIITTSDPVWSMCLDSSPNLRSAEPSKTTVKNATTVTGRSCHLKPQSEQLSLYIDSELMENSGAKREDVNPAKSVASQRKLPEYLIPRVNRFDYPQDVANHADSFPPSAPHPEIINPLAAIPPPHTDTSLAAFNTGMLTCPPNKKETFVHTIFKETPMAVKPNETEGDDEEITPVDIKDRSGESCKETATKDASEESNASAVCLPKVHAEKNCQNQKLRPKYKTINYGDPSVKETYKPKIIRFTDTFSF